MMLSKSHVACNIYISAGLPAYRGVLERLLDEAQHEQSKLHLTNKPSSQVVIVHAFADAQYDRTSFHLAGSPWAIADLATAITSHAMQILPPLKLEREREISREAADSEKRLEHPTVGIVDHISILPLGPVNDATAGVTWNEWQAYYQDHSDNYHGDDTVASFEGMSKPSITFPSGWVAWTIGWNLLQKENLRLDVLYYGHAHAKNRRLAEVRREKTNFFRQPTNSTQSGNGDDNGSNDGAPNDATTTSITTSPLSLGQCTIGAPPHFVENYNLRLTSKASKKLARSLTKVVRERDGGLPGVEALTLPYGSQDRFEVACNLLDPKVTTSGDIDEMVAQFWKENGLDQTEHLDIAYRVGTTEEQCLQALKQSQFLDQAEQHKVMVHRRFQACFESKPP